MSEIEKMISTKIKTDYRKWKEEFAQQFLNLKPYLYKEQFDNVADLFLELLRQIDGMIEEVLEEEETEEETEKEEE